MSDPRAVPPVPLILGVAGLAPFFGLAGLVAAGAAGVPGLTGIAPATALLAYAALILSFLGGVRWGVAVSMEDQERARREYILSVVPALVAWALLALSPSAGLWTACALTVALALFDYGLTCRNEAPEWYGRLRLGLGAGAALALGVAAAAV
jgi:hypothetical protein